MRELENVFDRATILAREGRLRFDLPEPRASASKAVADQEGMSPPLLTETERRERDRANIMTALEACGGKVFGPGGAAAILGIKPTTLASRIKTFGIR